MHFMGVREARTGMMASSRLGDDMDKVMYIESEIDENDPNCVAVELYDDGSVMLRDGVGTVVLYEDQLKELMYWLKIAMGANSVVDMSRVLSDDDAKKEISSAIDEEILAGNDEVTALDIIVRTNLPAEQVNRILDILTSEKMNVAEENPMNCCIWCGKKMKERGYCSNECRNAYFWATVVGD